MTAEIEILVKKFLMAIVKSIYEYNKFKNDPKCIESDCKNYEIE